MKETIPFQLHICNLIYKKTYASNTKVPYDVEQVPRNKNKQDPIHYVHWPVKQKPHSLRTVTPPVSQFE
jgi:hypothetical protein